MTSEYWTMREIGKLLGTTSHVIGKKLKEIGLRTPDGRPSHRAFAGGYCDQRWTEEMTHYCWAWHKDKTLRALEEAGMARTEES
jgi:hypothetical protein